MKKRDGKRRIKKRTFKKALLILLLVILVYNLIWNISELFDKKLSILGINLYIENDNSMKPRLSKNDLVIARKFKKDSINKEDVIIYLKYDEYRISRVMNIHENSNITSYVIRGDNNYYAEEILDNAVKGKMIIRVPYGGVIINILRSIITGIILIGYLIVVVVYNKKVKEKSKERRELKKKEDTKV